MATRPVAVAAAVASVLAVAAVVGPAWGRTGGPGWPGPWSPASWPSGTPSAAALVWPPAGIALAVLLVFGDGVLPAIVLGCAVGLLVRHEAGARVAIGAGATAIEAWFGASMLRRIPGFRPSLDRTRDVGGLLAGAALLAPAVGALAAVMPRALGLLFGHGASAAPLSAASALHELVLTWAARWAADGLGVLLFAPPLLVGLRPARARVRVSAAVQAFALGLALVGTCGLAFQRSLGPAGRATPFLVYPLLVGVVLRFGTRCGVIAGLLTSVAAWVCGAQGLGPFAGFGAMQTVVALQLFIGATMATVLLHGAGKAEREDALRASRDALDHLEARVEQRTGQLLQVNHQLAEQIDERRRAEGELRRRELALRSSEERFRAVAETAKDAIITCDRAGRVCYANHSTVRLLGFGLDTLMGRHFSMLLPLGTREASQERIQRQLRAPGQWLPATPMEVSARRMDGGEVPVELTLARWRTPGGALYFTGIARDLTERRREEERLRRSEERFRLLVDGVRDLAIFGIDRTGRVTSWNSGAERLFGFQSIQIVGGHFSRLFGEDDVASGRPEALLRIAASAGRLEDEGWRLRKDGTRFWANVIVSALYDDAGQVTGFAKVVRDLTERRQSEEALRRAHEGLEAHIRERTRDLQHANAELKRHIVERREVERSLARQARELAHTNAELELFGYVASHDLREPLRTVANYTQLLAQRYGGALDPRADEYIRFAVDAATWMHRLLDDLTTYARLGRNALALESLSGDRVLDIALTNLSLAIEESGAVVTHDPLPTLVGDGPQLVQLLQNLIGNAIKFRGAGPPRIHVSARQAARHWRFSVKDNGIGFDVKHLDRIFVAFQRLHTREEYAGTGVGLAICKKIVERHRGRIWAKSQPGAGSEFVFTLPIAPTPPRGRAARPAGHDLADGVAVTDAAATVAAAFAGIDTHATRAEVETPRRPRTRAGPHTGPAG